MGNARGGSSPLARTFVEQSSTNLSLATPNSGSYTLSGKLEFADGKLPPGDSPPEGGKYRSGEAAGVGGFSRPASIGSAGEFLIALGWIQRPLPPSEG